MGNRYLRKLLVVGAHAVLYSQAARRRAAILGEEMPLPPIGIGGPIAMQEPLGLAADIASFELANGEPLRIKPNGDEHLPAAMGL